MLKDLALNRLPGSDGPLHLKIAQQIRQFGNTLRDPETKPLSTAREHLVNVAIVESAYLSARTQLPETLGVYGELFDINQQ